VIQSAAEWKQQTWSPGEKCRVECATRRVGPREVSDMSPNRRSSSLAVWTLRRRQLVTAAAAGSDWRHSERPRPIETRRRMPTRYVNRWLTTTNETATSSRRCRHCCRTLHTTWLVHRRCYDDHTEEHRLAVVTAKRQNSLRRTLIDWYETKPAQHTE